MLAATPRAETREAAAPAIMAVEKLRLVIIMIVILMVGGLIGARKPSAPNVGAAKLLKFCMSRSGI
ncbi:hypothetical protein RsS62_22280 [Rhizobium dioscoreae]|nr:hypothetical protein RsS62_22280 [Rhizobium dioscoreae]